MTEALRHGGIANEAHIDLKYVDSEDIEEKGPDQLMSDVSGVLVPGGFGKRGIEGKIAAIRYAREHKIPFLGLCLGLQCAVIEFSRTICGLAGANSKEFDEGTPHPVVIYLKEQEYITELGGTMRLGAFRCIIKPGTLGERLYGGPEVSERHRHRYEVNNAYRPIMADCGLVVSGTSPTRPHPLFAGFVAAALDHGGRPMEEPVPDVLATAHGEE